MPQIEKCKIKTRHVENFVLLLMLQMYKNSTEMIGKCYNCDYEGEYKWHWLITDSKDDNIGHSTYSMTYEESQIGDTHTEIYYCPQCNAEQ